MQRSIKRAMVLQFVALFLFLLAIALYEATTTMHSQVLVLIFGSGIAALLSNKLMPAKNTKNEQRIINRAMMTVPIILILILLFIAVLWLVNAGNTIGY